MIVADDPVNPPGTKNKNDTVIHRVRRDFAFCSGNYFAVLIFGSYARGEEEHYSDIDICIVSKNRRNIVQYYMMKSIQMSEWIGMML